MVYEGIRMGQEAGLATLTLNRPATLNSLTVGVVTEMINALDRLRDEGKARVLLMTGAGRAFSSGGQLSGSATDEDPTASLESHYNL